MTAATLDVPAGAPLRPYGGLWGAMTRMTTKEQLWKRMVTLVKPYVTVSRVATRPRATTKPPPMGSPGPELPFDAD